MARVGSASETGGVACVDGRQRGWGWGLKRGWAAVGRRRINRVVTFNTPSCTRNNPVTVARHTHHLRSTVFLYTTPEHGSFYLAKRSLTLGLLQRTSLCLLAASVARHQETALWKWRLWWCLLRGVLERPVSTFIFILHYHFLLYTFIHLFHFCMLS